MILLFKLLIEVKLKKNNKIKREYYVKISQMKI